MGGNALTVSVSAKPLAKSRNLPKPLPHTANKKAQSGKYPPTVETKTASMPDKP
jgi:hypothetical protein